MRFTIMAAVILLASPAAGQSLPWQTQTHLDPLDDTRQTIAVTIGEDQSSISLVCHETNGVAAMFSPPLLTGFQFEDTVEVQYRVDSGQVATEHWRHLTSSNAFTSGEQAIRFARAVRQAQTRVVFNGYNETVVFSVDGSTVAVNQVLGECGQN